MKVVVITGGKSGIGSATVDIFLNNNYQVVVLDKEEVGKSHPKLLYYNCDISDEHMVKNVFEEIYKKFCKIDVLINCAGIQILEEWHSISTVHWNKVIKNNLYGTFYCLNQATKYLNRGGAVVNVTSIHAKSPRINNYPYDISKAGIELLGKDLAIELGRKGIRVNNVAPGCIDTPMNTDIDLTSQVIRDKIPIGRAGQPEEVAKVIYFLSTDSSSYIHGVTLTVDGGRNLIK